MTKKPSAVSTALAVARKYASGGRVGYEAGGVPGEWDWRSDMDAPAPGYDIRRGEVLPPYRPATELKEAQPGSVPTTREAAIDAILQETAIDAAKRYQNYPAPKRKVYTPWKAIDLNGIVRQVTYAGSVKTESEAVASIGESYSLGQSPAKLKARQEMQMKQLELQAMQFNQARSDQNAIQGIPSDSKAAQAFDASNMA